MSRSLREVLSAGAAPSVQAATTTGLELIRVAAEAPPLRDPVELNIDDQGVLSRSGAAAPAGVGVYTAPEVERNPDAEAAKVYFVCAVLYHLLSGRAPYPDVGSDALAVRKALEPVAPLGEAAPAALGALILAGLRADPAARPSLAQLGAILRAPPTLSAPSPAQMPSPMPAPMRAAMPPPMAAAPGGPGFSGSIPPVVEPPRRRRWPLPVALGCLTMLAVAGIAAVALLSVSREAPAPEPMATTAAPSQAVSDTAPPQAEAPASRRATEEREEAKKADDEAPAAPAMDGFGAPAAEAPAPAAPAPAAEAPAARASASRPAASGGAPGRGGASPSKSSSAAPAPTAPAASAPEPESKDAPAEPAPQAEALGGAAPEAAPSGASPAPAPAPPPVGAPTAPTVSRRGPSPAVWALMLVPIGLGVLLLGAGATGAAVYYTTRGTRRPRVTGDRSRGGTPSPPVSGGASTFPSGVGTAPPMPALDQPDPGFSPFMVGPFWCFGRIGEGGMGVVYKARHQSLGRLSAVKALPPRLAQDARSLSWFRREAQLAARVQHPNVVAIFDYGELPGGLLYLAMEYVSGEPLSKRVRLGGLVGSEVRALINQIAAGLDAAHAAGIVHRDLKPDNVVVQPAANGKFNAKILDFGIARPSDSPGDTSTDLIVGTAPYMSPEQARGEPDLDPRSDLFSLGVMTYELLTGRVPFVEPNMRTIQIVMRRGALHEAPPPVGTLRADLSPEVDRALAWVMAPDRKDRPGTATEFAEALSAALPR